MTFRARNFNLLVALICIIVLVISAFALDAHRQASAAATPADVPAPVVASPVAVRAHNSLLMLGDSITFSAVGPLDQELRASGWVPTILAKPGDRFRDHQAVAAQAADSHPDVVVINLGTNDAICLAQIAKHELCHNERTFATADLATDMQRMADLFPNDSTCIIAVLPTYGPEATVLWRFQFAAHAIDGLADWGAVTNEHNEYLVDPIGHIGAIGQPAYARFIADAVTRSCSKVS